MDASMERSIKRVLFGVGVTALAVALVLVLLNAWRTYQRAERVDQLNELGRQATLQVDTTQPMSVVGEPYPGEPGVDEDAVTYRNLLPWTGELQVRIESAKLAHSYSELDADRAVVNPVDSGYMIAELAVRVSNVDAVPKQETFSGHEWFLITDFGLYVDGLYCGDPVGFDGTPDDADPMKELWYFALEPGEEALYHVYYAVEDSLCTPDSSWAYSTGDFGSTSEESELRMGSASISLGCLAATGEA